MPKRISDVSLHVHATPADLERIVTAVRAVLDHHLTDRDVFAWRFTLPVDDTDPAHLDLESRWRTAHPGREPENITTSEIALSLVGATEDLTDEDIADLEHALILAVYALGTTDAPIPFTLRTDHSRPASELDHLPH